MNAYISIKDVIKSNLVESLIPNKQRLSVQFPVRDFVVVVVLVGMVVVVVVVMVVMVMGVLLVRAD